MKMLVPAIAIGGALLLLLLLCRAWMRQAERQRHLDRRARRLLHQRLWHSLIGGDRPLRITHRQDRDETP